MYLSISIVSYFYLYLCVSIVMSFSVLFCVYFLSLLMYSVTCTLMFPCETRAIKFSWFGMERGGGVIVLKCGDLWSRVPRTHLLKGQGRCGNDDKQGKFWDCGGFVTVYYMLQLLGSHLRNLAQVLRCVQGFWFRRIIWFYSSWSGSSRCSCPYSPV